MTVPHKELLERILAVFNDAGVSPFDVVTVAAHLHALAILGHVSDWHASQHPAPSGKAVA